MDVSLTLHPRATAARVASVTASALRTGSAPGRARHTGQVLAFGDAPKSAEQPQKALLVVLSCTCTSSPTTISYMSLLMRLRSRWFLRTASSVRFLAECLLESVGNAKHRGLIEMICQKLPANRKIVGTTNRHRHPGHAGEVRCSGEDIAQVHLVWIADRADWKRSRRCSRREKHVYAIGEYIGEIARDELADFLGLLVIGVVIARGEHVRTK